MLLNLRDVDISNVPSGRESSDKFKSSQTLETLEGNFFLGVESLLSPLQILAGTRTTNPNVGAFYPQDICGGGTP